MTRTLFRILLTITTLCLCACQPQSDKPTTFNHDSQIIHTASSLMAAQAATQPAAMPVTVYAGLLPGLVNSADQGPFIDLLKALQKANPGIRFSIRAYPMQRALAGLINGMADINFPALRNPDMAGHALPYRFSTESFGKVAHVIYSRQDHPLNREDINQFARHMGPPLKLFGGADFFAFPMEKPDDITTALKMLDAGRVDGVIWAQEEADYELQRLKLSHIHRALYGYFDDVFILQPGDRGEQIDKLLSQGLDTMRKTGQLQQLYQRIHRPYQDWQP